MYRLFINILFLILIPSSVFSQMAGKTQNGKDVILFDDYTWEYADPLRSINPSYIQDLELPKDIPGNETIIRTGYRLSYNKFHSLASWAAYELTSGETNSVFKRGDKFLVDKSIKGRRATDKDYDASGFDRGHLAPAGDMGWSKIAMEESFYYSNICPQTPSFNRGIWKRLEDLSRKWAKENESIYITTGPVLKDGLSTIGPNKISVPIVYYKVILDYRLPDVKGIGFIIPNSGSDEPLQNYSVTIDSVESVTGIDFFNRLPDNEEELIESYIDINKWTWDDTVENEMINSSENINSATNNSNSVSMQCKGIKKAGTRCKNKTTNTNGYCYLHVDQYKGDTLDNSSENISNKTPDSKTIYTGPRGGRYHYSKTGRKVYEKKK